MRKTRWIVIALGISAIMAYAVSNLEFEGTAVDYAASIEMKRAETKRFFETSAESPVKNIADFEGLFYYPPDQSYQIKADLELFESPETTLITTSDNKSESYLKFAWANFELQGKTHRLLLLKKNMADPFLFLAFSDKTSGSATYGGGRYLNVPYKRGTKTATLDFNLAYHPYCVYNHKFVCPLPPAENHLEVAVEAGERLNTEAQ